MLHQILEPYLKTRLRDISHFLRHPHEVQHNVAMEILQKAKLCKWAIENKLDKIDGLSEFRSEVPLQKYDDVKPYVDRMLRGENDVLWPGEVKWFAKSSGTTSSKSKFIPVTKEALKHCHYKASRDLMAMYVRSNPESQIFNGKGLLMGGSHSVNQVNQRVLFGDLSAVLMQNLPILAKIFQTPELEISLMDDWEEKIERMAQATVNQNVTNISGVPSWTLVLINKLFEITGKNNLADIWPKLELYIHGGVSFTPYRNEFNKLIMSDNMHYRETYNASEGFFAFQDKEGVDDMLLVLDYGIFYEFIDSDHWDEDNPKTLWLDQVETGKNYELVITTNSGLYRYRIGDTIRFTSIKPFRIQITGRTKHFINVFGEEVMVDNTDRALAVTCQKHDASVKEYSVGPVFLTTNDKGGHEWVIEFEKSPINLTEFEKDLDLNLQAVNSDYEAKRVKNLALNGLVIRPVSKGTFYRWLKYKGKLGGQHKVPRLSNQRSYIEEILKFDF
ncbi:MAG: GH3 auxin-responsive promoter family protein [Chitinophagales bacterium]|nr:GH3 auxin-responsive promoter family protein [Chitinophagales bacterium]